MGLPLPFLHYESAKVDQTTYYSKEHTSSEGCVVNNDVPHVPNEDTAHIHNVVARVQDDAARVQDDAIGLQMVLLLMLKMMPLGLQMVLLLRFKMMLLLLRDLRLLLLRILMLLLLLWVVLLPLGFMMIH